MRNTKWIAALAAGAVLASVGAEASTGVAAGTPPTICRTAKIAFMGPLTGDAGAFGSEQLAWAEYAVKVFDKTHGTHYGLYRGDTQLDPALAATLSGKYVADKRVLAIVGPSTSSGVASSAATLNAANLAAISPSATRTSLTVGPEAIGRFFFRTVPNDSVQAPSVAAFVVAQLKAKKVYVIDDQESYSLGLADSVSTILKGRRVTVARDSVTQATVDFASIIARIPADTGVVFIPWQQPLRAEAFAEQLAAAGKKAKVIGSDLTSSPEQFRAPGAYVSDSTPNLVATGQSRALVAGYLALHPGEKVGRSGPPAYGATQLALTAIFNACKAGKGRTTRVRVLKAIPQVRLKSWILGGAWKGFSRSQDPLGAKFSIFEIQSDGSYKLVG
ncbi:MAG: branched-chain amino acid ABC transporter substrate-binding protein [Gaiellaceae bacterium]